LTKEVETLKETVQKRDEALSGTGQEIETLRATIHDKDEALRAAEKARGEVQDWIMGWQTHAEGRFLLNFDLDSRFLCFC
jgi:chromosome segregation ATPase